ncbi:MAG: acetate--CoA ligase family protein [Deltaproteobacteria bacterium]|nr:acetate--CoA ligase family protein [Deltaproteobacteria bacterium]MBW2072525.1 acetate--CoA ligase family protein [Deltaproteobacteria bacterium]
MKGFFYADSVAVVGVSPSPTNLARAIVFHLVEFDYSGTVYLVGPRGGSFMGHKIYRTVEEIPDSVDLAVLLTPAHTLPEIVASCGRKGIKRFIIESAGFRELGEDRLGLEQEILSLVNKYGMRFIGPNCIGIINKENGLAVPFMPFRNEFNVGRLSIISQSGGVGGALLNALAAEGLGFNKFASIGNKLNTDENDLLEYFLEDEGTGAVFLYLEGISDGRRLMELAFQAKKPILACMANTTEASAHIARSHTASLSSAEEVVQAAFQQCGIQRFVDMRSAMDMIKACHLPAVRGDRLAVVSRSGGHAVVAADAAATYGFQLPPYPEELLHQVESRLRAKVIRLGNPMDLGDLFDFDLFESIVRNTLARDDIDAMLMVYNYNGVFFQDESRMVVGAVKEVCLEMQKPLALCVVTTDEEFRVNRKRHAGFPLFSEPREAAHALAFSRDIHSRKIFTFAEAEEFAVDGNSARQLLGAAVLRGARQLSMMEAFRLLSCYGIAVVPWAAASSSEEAVACARDLGFPVAMKVMVETIVHKSDVGGVLLHLTSEDEVRAAYDHLVNLAKEYGGAGAEPAVLLQQMVAGGIEVIVGGKRDHNFGPLVLFGLGGIYVEVLGDVCLRIAPVARAEAERMVQEIRGYRILQGVRGEPAAHVEAIVETIQRVSQLLMDLPEIQEMDINPLKVFPEGQGCSAVDCRIILSPAQSGR